MHELRIAAIPGDGVGSEVLDVGLDVLRAAITRDGGVELDVEFFPWGSHYYSKHGRMGPDDMLDVLRPFDAIYFGAVGWPDVPDDVALWGLRLAIVQGYDQWLNLRPSHLIPGVEGPLRDRGADEIDFVVVRENSEGEYCGIGGRAHKALDSEVAIQTSVYSRRAVRQVAEAAFEVAMARPAKRLASITKSNASQYASVLWDEVVAEVAGGFPEIEFESVLVDAAAARLVLDPGSFDVLVASNLHADILSDLTGALCGSIGVAPSGNYDPSRRNPSMFEPVHGSAPDIAGSGKANPVGAVLSGAMMLEHLGHPRLAAQIRIAVDQVCAAGVLTRDVGGNESTAAVGAALVEAVVDFEPAET